MRSRTLLAVLLVAALAAATPADAAPKKKKKKPKPITKTYQVTNPLPHPYPPDSDACSSSPEGVSEDREKFVAPAKGKLKVVVSEFTGDWDIGLFGDSDKRLANGGGVNTPDPQMGTGKETLNYTVKKKMNLFIDVCNFLGGPDGTVTYTFTFT